jgi:hypothetical protein
MSGVRGRRAAEETAVTGEPRVRTERPQEPPAASLLLDLQRSAGNRAVERLVRGTARPGVLQRRFRIREPDNEDCIDYGWVESDDEKEVPKGSFRYCGSFSDVGGINADVLYGHTGDGNNRWWYVRTMFGKTAPKPVPDDKLHDKEFMKLAQQGLDAMMTKRDTTPSGDIGRMNFRFAASEGTLWHVPGGLPLGYKPNPGVQVIETNASTVNAMIGEHVFSKSGVVAVYGETYVTDRFVYVRRPQSRTGEDTAPVKETAKYVFGGRGYTLAELAGKSDALSQAADKVDKLAAVNTDQLLENVVGELKGKDREGGQVNKMAGMNANAYAVARGLPNAQTTNWEWLHIRGARLGGVTGPSNLVPGTAMANSEMIIFEQQLLELSRAASHDQPVRIRWAAELHGWPRVAIKITISWDAPNGLQKGDKFIREGGNGYWRFDPFGGQIIDRDTRDLQWQVWDTFKVPTSRPPKRREKAAPMEAAAVGVQGGEDPNKMDTS